MSSPFEFVLPPRLEPQPDAKALVGATPRNAITGQKQRLVFPKRQTLAAHFALQPAQAGVLRRDLVDSRHLSRIGNEYFTAHPVSGGTTTPETT